MILDGADDAWVVRPVSDGRFEDDSLVVPFALTLRFDTVGTGGALLAALDTTLATGQATSLGPLAHLGSGCRACAIACW